VFQSVDAANLDFPPVVPRFGVPDAIQATPADTDPASQSVVFVFNLPDEGRVVVEEHPAGDLTIDSFRQMVEAREGLLAEPSLGGDESETPAFQMVPFRGSEAMLVQNHGIGRLTWIQDGVVIDVYGERISPEQVLRLAETL
jgi:hypothetical protein